MKTPSKTILGILVLSALFLVLAVPIAYASIDLVAPFPGQRSFDGGDPGALSEWINNLYAYAIGLGTLLAMAVIVFGGVRYMFEAGKPFMQSEAKAWIFGGVIGLIILIGAALILATINPDIIDLGLSSSIQKDIEDKNREFIQKQRELIAETRRQYALNAPYQEEFDARKTGTEGEVNEILASSFLNDLGRQNKVVLAALKIIDIQRRDYLQGEKHVAGQNGHLAALRELFDENPDLKETYMALKADLAAPNEGQRDRFETWVDEGARTNPTFYFPPEYEQFASDRYRQQRHNGTISEADDADDSPSELAQRLLEIENRPYIADSTLIGVLGARDGYIQARNELFEKHGGDNGDNRTRNAYYELKAQQPNNWVNSREPAGH